MARALTAPPDARRARVRRQLLLMLLVGLAPIAASYVAYYWWPRDARVNYGVLRAEPAPDIRGQTLDGRPFALAELRGKWVMLTAADGRCASSCERALHAGRQARTIQNADMSRVARVWLVTDDAAPPPALLAQHADLAVVRVEPAVAARLPDAGAGLALIDPLGNVVLTWPADPDIKAMAKDLSRLLRASSIG